VSETGQKVAIVTGGSQGIGAGLVDGYRQRRWAVVANSLDIKPSKDPDVLTVAGDVSEQATADQIISQAIDRFGRVDTLVNNAGVFVSKPFIDYTAEDYALVIGVNLAGFFWLTQRAIGQMLKQHSGHVVNISASVADRADSVEPTALAALTKGGLAAVTRSLAVEYASRGIRPRPTRPRRSRGNCPRSGAWARSVTSWTPSCTWSQRRTSPERSCTSAACRAAGCRSRLHVQDDVGRVRDTAEAPSTPYQTGSPCQRRCRHAKPGNAGPDRRLQGPAEGQCQPGPADDGRAPRRLRPRGPPSSGA
jgi:NADP-dependent 3-hydroxy acid dehydrogenase YdfG